MRPRLRAGVVAAALAAAWWGGGAGCAYFNGMYNASRFARQAEQSEKAGRISEARDRWQSAALHAESLTTRHPNSRWVFDALLVRGRALVHLLDFPDAAVVLETAARRAERPEQRREAFALLGQADLAIGRFAEARAALDSGVESTRPQVRSEALLYRGRALLALGMPDSAQADFRASSHPHAPFELGRVELSLRDTAAAAARYDALVPVRPYAEADWRPALDSLAAAGAGAHAARLVDRLASRSDLTRGQRARLLLDDGARRLESGDTAAAAARFQGVQASAQDSVEAKTAAVVLSRLAIARAAGDSDLASETARLRALTQEGGSAGRDAQGVLRQLERLDLLGAAASAPDAYWFERAELLRDSLHAGRLAAMAFAEMARRFPESPWTPKGLIAAIAAGHPAADSLRALLDQRYAQNPYAAAAAGRGGGEQAFAALEDSLRRALSRRIAAPRPAANAVRRAGDEDDEEIPGRGRQRDAPVPVRPGAPAPSPSSPRPETGPPKPPEPLP